MADYAPVDKPAVSDDARRPAFDLQDELPRGPCECRTRPSVPALALVAAAACLVLLWGSAPGAVRTEVAAAPLVAEEVASRPRAERSCLELPGVRLQNGEGSPHGSGREAADPQACSLRCREMPDCGQAIFSAGNNGCYLFKEAAEGLAEFKADGDDAPSSAFTSVVCSSTPLEMALLSAEAKKKRLAAVQSEWAQAETRAQALLKTLQPADKFALLHGVATGSGFAGYLDPNQGGGNPTATPLAMNDGPQGFNVYTDPDLAGTSTQFPSLLMVAASFNPETSRRYAGAIVEEFVGKGSNVLLGPDLEVIRVASTGRSFETLSGEDPYLGSQLAPAFVREVQRNGIIATVKHWLDNNQEIGRMTMNVEVDDRTQHEIYMPAFKAAIEAGAGAVMCSYNKVYGTHSCENSKLLKDLLRRDVGFRGFVMSDWGATHDAVRSATSGLDVEMPGDNGEFAKLPTLVSQGVVAQSTVDAMAGHVLASMYAAGHFDGRYPGKVPAVVSHGDVTSEAHRDVAVKTILDGAVLLKNERATLPLATAGKKIAMVGKYCKQTTFIAPDHVTASTGTPFMGQGSGYVPTVRTVSPLQGLQDLVKDAASIDFSNDASAAEGADVAIVCVSDCDVHEGWDRMNFSLPEAEELVTGVRELGGDTKVVVVGVAPGAVTTEWIQHADASLLLFMPGEQVGRAVAQLLTGAASPAGRLPVTMPPDNWTPIGGWPAGIDHQFLSDQYPGNQPPPHQTYKWGDHLTANFTEGLLVGYRWFDANGVKPAFPFGFGLTYTTFSFEGFEASCEGKDILVSGKVANVGGRDGKAVPQLYVGFDSLRPAVRQLKGFLKLEVAAGAEADAAFVVTPEDASYYDAAMQRWVSAAEKGENVTVSVGTSSAEEDLVWHATLRCGSSGAPGAFVV